MVILGEPSTTEPKKINMTIRGHIARQDLFNQESGGLTANALNSFVTEDPNFDNRARMDVNLVDAENQFDGNRLYLEHSFKLLASKDTVNKKDFSNLKIGHIFTNENKIYRFIQTTVTPSIFGDVNASEAKNSDAEHRS